MFRTCIFLALIALAVAFGALAIITDENFFVGVWPQLFWLTFSVIAMTFFVETILRHDEANRRRAEDGFAFRTFAANILARLLEISAVRTDVEDLFVAALSGKGEFDRAAERVTRTIGASGSLDGELYNRSYLDVGSGLRDLARNYIRLFSSSQREMIAVYRELEKLAADWKYRAELSRDYRADTNKLRQGDDERSRREQETEKEEAEAKMLIDQTATYLSDLARKAATIRGLPAVG
jgi:hypothetical protein